MGAVEARSGLKRANSSMSVRSGQSSYSNRSSWLRRTLSSASVRYVIQICSGLRLICDDTLSFFLTYKYHQKLMK